MASRRGVRYRRSMAAGARPGWRRSVVSGVVATALLAGGGCSDAATSAPMSSRSASSGGPASVADDELLFCVAETNRLRATLGAGAVTRSAEVEAYAAQAARADGTNATTHGYTSGPNGPKVSFAENEVLRWPLARYGSIHGLITAAIAAFWNEGPGGGHYENMRGPWTRVGCGLFVDGDRVTLVQHFR